MVSNLFCWERKRGCQYDTACQDPGVLDRQLCMCGQPCQEKQHGEGLESHTEGLESQGYLLSSTLGNGNLKRDDRFNKYLSSAYYGEDLCCKTLTVRAVWGVRS